MRDKGERKKQKKKEPRKDLKEKRRMKRRERAFLRETLSRKEYRHWEPEPQMTEET